MNGYHSTNPKRRGRQIKIVLKSIARPKKSPELEMLKKAASPMLAFASGPGFESREPQVDLRDLVGVNVNEVDDSLKDILIERPARPSSIATTDDNDDTVSTVSEISTGSSAVTVILEPVEESTDLESENLITKSRKKPKAPPSPSASRYTDHTSSYNSSSEAEDEESRKSGRKSKKISNLFSFSSSSPPNQTVILSSENSSADQIPLERKRRSSFSKTKKMSPLSLGFFSGLNNSNQNIADSKQDLTNNNNVKEIKKITPLPKPNRKLSLTMFQKQGDKVETRKRRNTDPSLGQKQRGSTIPESSSELKADGDEPSPERPPRKVSFSTLGPSVQELRQPPENEITSVVPREAFFKEDDIKLRDLMEDILRAHMLSMRDYRKETCDRTGKSISKVIKTLVEAMKAAEGLQSKVVCLVYMAAIRDRGIVISTQALWNPDQDNFAAASFRNDSIFGLATVIVTPLL